MKWNIVLTGFLLCSLTPFSREISGEDWYKKKKIECDSCNVIKMSIVPHSAFMKKFCLFHCLCCLCSVVFFWIIVNLHHSWVMLCLDVGGLACSWHGKTKFLVHDLIVFTKDHVSPDILNSTAHSDINTNISLSDTHAHTFSYIHIYIVINKHI